MANLSHTATRPQQETLFALKDWVVIRVGEYRGQRGQIIGITPGTSTKTGHQNCTVSLDSSRVVVCGSLLLRKMNAERVPVDVDYAVLSECGQYALVRRYDEFDRKPGELVIGGHDYVYCPVSIVDTGDAWRLWKKGTRPEDADSHSVIVYYDGSGHCTCGDFTFRAKQGRECKHLKCVRALGIAKPKPDYIVPAKPTKTPVVYEIGDEIPF